MSQPLFLNHRILPFLVVPLLAALGCAQPGLAQPHSVGTAPVIGAAPITLEDALRPNKRSRVSRRRDKASASLATQSKIEDGPTPIQMPPAQSLPLQSTTPPTTITAPLEAVSDCDYWIVSSRSCDGKDAIGEAGCSLSYFHRTSDEQIGAEGRDSFLASIRPDRPVCFVVHGSYNYWRDVMSESRKIYHWIRSGAPNSPVQVVFFTWPADGYMPYLFPVDIAILGRRSTSHGMYLANLIAQVPADQRVSIVGHSHGARATVAALHLLGGGALENGQALPPGHAAPVHLRVVLIAAAIDHNWLNPGDRYGQALLVPEQVLLMRNSRDATLVVYPLRKGVGPRALGRNGLGKGDRFELGALGSKVVDLDAAEFAKWHHSFGAFHQRPELAAAIAPYVYFQEVGPMGPSLQTRPAIGPTTAPAIGPATGPVIEATPISPAPTVPEMKPQAAPVSLKKYFEGPKASAEKREDTPTPVPRRNPVELRIEE